MSDRDDPLQEQKLIQLKLYIYLIPVLGFLPALWTLYWRKGSGEEQKVSRLSITLAGTWLLGYALLWTGAWQTDHFLTLRLLFLNSMFTSGYFLLSFALMIRLWRGKSARLPWISRIAERVFNKH